MTDEKIKERFEEIQEQIDEYTKRVEALQEDLKILIRLSPGNIVEQARQQGQGSVQSQWANVADNPAWRAQCIKFFERYRSDSPPA